jgi:hypothetical protein
MDKINMGSVIEQAITKVTRNRIGAKPAVFVTLSPALTQVPWKDSGLKKFVEFFLYEALLTSDAAAAVEISLRRRSLLRDLTKFVGMEPTYWVQLRISGCGLRIAEPLIEDLFSEAGYRCEEWVGTAGASARLGIFGAIDAPKLKMVFCLESTRSRLRCDLLLPVLDHCPVPSLVERAA